MKYTWKKTNNGVTDNLGTQMQKIVRTMNENKFNTRWRYIAAEARFIHFASKEFKLKKLNNIQDKHLERYVIYLKSQNTSEKYIKNELSAIRFFHNHTPGTKHELTDATQFNKAVNLGSTADGRADRAWTEREIERMKETAVELGKPEVARVVEAVRTTGMRIDEVCNVRWQHIHDALKTGTLKLEGSLTKGAVSREIPVTDRARNIFENALKNGERGGYVFTPKIYVESHIIHKFEKAVQNFIGYHRDKIQDADRSNSGHNLAAGDRGALTAHGLRHSFGREQYLNRRASGMSKDIARLEVSKMLGHGRDSVTYIYLGGIEK